MRLFFFAVAICGGELGQIASNVLLAFPFNSVLQEICAGVEMSPRLPSVCCVVLKDCASCRRSLLVPGIAKRLASAMQVQPWAGPQKESDHPCSRHSFWLGPRVWFRVLFGFGAMVRSSSCKDTATKECLKALAARPESQGVITYCFVGVGATLRS